MSQTDYNQKPNEQVTIGPDDLHVVQAMWNLNEFITVFNGANHWTRITIIGGATYDKDKVLRAILHAIYPTEVFPALYQPDGNDTFFLVKNCANMIKKLVLTNLKVPDPDGNFITLNVTTHFLSTSLESLNVYNQIKSAITKRTNLSTRTIDLTNFSQDECFKDVFFHLSVPQCMQHTLNHICNTHRHLSVSRPSNTAVKPHTLILQHNSLTNLEYFDSKIVPFIQNVDLRYNKLDWDGLGRFRPSRLNAIWLDGNPLCKGIKESDYMKKIHKIVPTIMSIDGVEFSLVLEKAMYVKNYFCDPSWVPFIDHFLHHYFSLMEGPNRCQLARLYHTRALFSLSVSQNPVEIMEHWDSLQHYMIHSRNLVTLSDLRKAYTSMKVGPAEVMAVLSSLPMIQFDPYSFTVDVPYADNDKVLINVSGLFQEFDSGLFYFDRSLVLVPFKKNEGEWKIINDMLSLSTASAAHAEKSFTSVRQAPSPAMKLTLNSMLKERDVLIPTFCDITKLTKEWAVKFLTDGSWDLERTLQAFTDQLKSNQIPMIAFSI